MYVVMDSPRVRELREERGLSRRDLAQAVGLAESTLRRVERGGVVRLATVRKVAAHLGEEPVEIARPHR